MMAAGAAMVLFREDGHPCATLTFHVSTLSHGLPDSIWTSKVSEAWPWSRQVTLASASPSGDAAALTSTVHDDELDDPRNAAVSGHLQGSVALKAMNLSRLV